MEHLNNLLDQLEQLNDGELRLTSKSGQWRFYILDGQLLYASGQALAVRRFHRAAYYHRANWKWGGDPTWSVERQAWEVLLLERAIAHNQLSPIQVKLILRMVLGECLFELLHDGITTSEWLPYHLEASSTYRSASLSLLEVKRIVGKTERLVETWKKGPLGHLQLSSSPLLLPNNETPENETPSTATESLALVSQYLNGHNDLWDIFLNQVPSLDRLARLLLPLAETGRLQFKSLPDLPLPIASESDPGNALSATAVSTNQTGQQTGQQTANQTEPNLTETNQATAPFAESASAPTAPPITQSAAPPITQSAAPPITQPAAQSALIACIDDSPVLTLALKKVLTAAGYRTLSIPEPMRGFAKLIEHRPDLILLDLMLPNADGYSICKFLRETPAFAKTPIIILTGQDTNLDRMRARLAGATEFLGKPPKADELISMIGRHLEETP